MDRDELLRALVAERFGAPPPTPPPAAPKRERQNAKSTAGPQPHPQEPNIDDEQSAHVTAQHWGPVSTTDD